MQQKEGGMKIICRKKYSLLVKHYEIGQMLHLHRLNRDAIANK